VDDLVQWLRAQLDEDAARALAALSELDGPELGADWEYDGRYVSTVRERTMVAVGSQDFMGPTVGAHIAAHDPARVLREIDAKRRAVDYLVEEIENAEVWWYDDKLIPVLKLLALPYADRPGYREEWAP